MRSTKEESRKLEDCACRRRGDFLTKFAQMLEFDAFCKTIPFRDNAIAGFNVKILAIYTFCILSSRHTLNTLHVCHVHRGTFLWNCLLY